MRIGRERLGIASVLVVVAAVSVMAVAACQPNIIVVDGMTSDTGDTPECPHTWTFKREDLVSFLLGTRTNVPEFHDCQKLRVAKDEYGPLAAVFAIDRLESVQDSALGATRGRVLALVHLPQGGAYGALGLSKAWACVIVRVRGTGGDAWIVPVDRGDQCASPHIGDVTALRSPLDLHVLPSPKGLDRQIPPVARWDWDDSTSTQYIGVRCGSAWCEIGRRNFRSSASHDPGASTDLNTRAGYAFRGAYDEQRLAEFSTGVLTPGTRLGTVVPMPDLDGLTKTRPPNGQWVPVARTYLTPFSEEYQTKFNFAATATVSPNEARASTVSLCVGTDTEACGAIERNTTLDISLCTPEVPSGARWIARVDRPGAPSKYFCVLYRGHSAGFYVPPVVRWRWRADDETIWISCPSGCCEVKART